MWRSTSGHAARPLQHRQRLAHAAVGPVHLVEEQDARDLPVFQRLQDDLEGGNLLLVRLRDDDREIDRRDDRFGLEGEFDRAGTVEDGDPVAHEIGLGDIHLDAHLVRPRFRRAVADGILFADGALPRHRTGAREDGFKK